VPRRRHRHPAPRPVRLRVVCPEPVLAKHDNLLHHSPGRRCLFGPFVRRGFVVRTSAKRQQRECVPPIHPPACLPDAPAWLPSLPGVPACLPAQLQCFCALLLPSGLLSVCARLTVCANVISRSVFCLLALCCRFRKNRGDGSSTAGGVSAFAATLRTT
jgi:hypothetical protein